LVAAARVATDGTVEQATLFCLVYKFREHQRCSWREGRRVAR
jgi:hypothetical protein